MTPLGVLVAGCEPLDRGGGTVELAEVSWARGSCFEDDRKMKG